MFGADALTLAGAAANSKAMRTKSWGVMAGAALSTLGRAPFSLAEALYSAAGAGATLKNAPPPIFILGHWRSGTTHLYNIMAKAERFAYVSPFATALPHDFLTLGKLLEPLLAAALPKTRLIDQVTVDKDSPQEDEIALANMTGFSYYHALYFPARFEEIFTPSVFMDEAAPERVAAWGRLLKRFYGKLLMAQRGDQLLIKNPVYTARARLLAEIFPGAKFIHIHRDPYAVFMSMRNFYRVLLAQFALEDYAHVDIDEVILSTYARMMSQMIEDTSALPRDRFVELSYQSLREQPQASLGRIYDGLKLEGFAEDAPVFERYLASVKGYQRARYDYPKDVVAKVNARWSPFFEPWSYAQR